MNIFFHLLSTMGQHFSLRLTDMFKRDSVSKDILIAPGEEYYNNAVPFEGIYLDYVDRLLEVRGVDSYLTRIDVVCFVSSSDALCCILTNTGI